MKRDTSSLKWIYKRIRSYAFWLVVLIVMATLVSYINVQFALVSKRLIDVATGQTAGSVADSALALGALLIVQLLLQVLYIRIHIKISGKLTMSMRTDLFYLLMKKDYAGVSKLHSGEILNRLVSDVSLVAEKVTEIVPNVVALLSTVVFSFIALYQLDKQLAVVCLAFGPVIMAAAYIYKKRIKNLHLKCRESDGRVRAFLQESIQNLLVIKVFNRADVMRHRSGGLQLENFHLNVKRATIGILANVLFFVVVTAGYYAALAWSVYRLSIGVITFGTVTAVLGLVGQLQTPFREFASLFPQFYMVLASAERLMELEDLKESAPLLISDEKDINAFQSIDFCNVCFSYGDVRVLDNVNLSVKRGEFVALCGNSGAGKSTLSKLMLSVIPADSGKICLTLENGDSIPIEAAANALFSYVPQGNLILSGTILDNITFAEEQPDMDRVMRAVMLSQLSDVIEQAPLGLSTVLGEKGHGLSEGQIQRIAIARALYRDAPVLLLDEATSALDIRTEQALLSTLKQLTDKTCIIISHRKEVLEACDKTYFMQDGTLQVL